MMIQNLFLFADPATDLELMLTHQCWHLAMPTPSIACFEVIATVVFEFTASMDHNLEQGVAILVHEVILEYQALPNGRVSQQEVSEVVHLTALVEVLVAVHLHY